MSKKNYIFAQTIFTHFSGQYLIGKISSVVNDSKKEIEEIKKECGSYTKQLKSEISKLDDKVATLKNQLETTTKGLMKSSNINRWIVIAGVVILAVLMFVIK